MTVTTEITKIENIFDKFNEHFYNGELVRPVITYSADITRQSIGWCTVKEVWYDKEQTNYEINICANMVKYNDGGVCEVLLHEMAHLYNLKHGIKDVSNNGFYHNKKYKATAEAHGLIANCHPTYGYNNTVLNDEAKELMKSFEGLEMFYINPEMEKKTATAEEAEEEAEEEPKTRQKRTFVYRCPVCGEEIKSKNPDGTYYDDCGEKFERVG